MVFVGYYLCQPSCSKVIAWVFLKPFSWSKKLIIFHFNGVLYYLSICFVLQRCLYLVGWNIGTKKVEKRHGFLHFLALVFSKFHVIIWLCILLKDVLKLFHLLRGQCLICTFIIIWGKDKCCQMLVKITPTLS